MREPRPAPEWAPPASRPFRGPRRVTSGREGASIARFHRTECTHSGSRHRGAPGCTRLRVLDAFGSRAGDSMARAVQSRSIRSERPAPGRRRQFSLVWAGWFHVKPRRECPCARCVPSDSATTALRRPALSDRYDEAGIDRRRPANPTNARILGTETGALKSGNWPSRGTPSSSRAACTPSRASRSTRAAIENGS